ncbi:glutathione S-transferase [Daedalea quercina L-15889]|uniref:Glutathione S-transferase n=1 Tax=Daedalea quercina L-15889 TaxID=1314783 RepID=A0A165QA57_9APHY|nr:glutathione S-transferase [Daedalea quercina L-15889]
MSTRDVTHLSDLSKMVPSQDGSFNRAPSQFRNWVEQGGKYEAEKGRYHLYVSYGCPWAARTLIMRQLKGLEDFIPITVLSPRLDELGWPFANIDPFPGAEVDPLYSADHLKDIYLRVTPDYEGRFTVPVLYDKKTETIVNNESSEIIRIFNSAFNHLLPADKAKFDLYPEHLRKEIDELNTWVYDTTDGVYKAVFAANQSAYEKAVYPLFESLDRLEKILDGKDYLIGDQLTEADIRLFVTIIRFDVAYYSHCKCNIRDIRNGYPAIHLWLRKLYWNVPAFKDTCDFDHIKTGYYWAKSARISANP